METKLLPLLKHHIAKEIEEIATEVLNRERGGLGDTFEVKKVQIGAEVVPCIYIVIKNKENPDRELTFLSDCITYDANKAIFHLWLDGKRELEMGYLIFQMKEEKIDADTSYILIKKNSNQQVPTEEAKGSTNEEVEEAEIVVPEKGAREDTKEAPKETNKNKSRKSKNETNNRKEN